MTTDELFENYKMDAGDFDDLQHVCNTLNEIARLLGSNDYSRDNVTLDDLVDTSSLPTFGGPVPEDTSGIYSWDGDGLLVVGTCGNWVIELRDND